MNSSTFVEAVRDENATALSRLGSGKALFATAGGRLETTAILTATANAERTTHETFARLADREPDPQLRALFESVAAEEAEHHRRVLERLDGEPGEISNIPAIHRYLRDLDDSIGRLGGFVGRSLAAREATGPLIGFFVGKADPPTADLIRTFRDDVDEQLDRSLDLLESTCRSPDDRERALEAANGAIQAAYAEYVETLDSFDIDHKPVC